MADSILETLLILIRGEDTQFRRTLTSVEREAQTTGAAVRRSLDFRDIGANLGGLAGGGGILAALRSMAQESARAEGETRSFLNTLERAGVPQEAMTDRLEATANRVGLLREQLQSAATPLIKMGVDADSVDRVLLGLASSAGIAGKSGRELAESVTNGAIGLSMGRSELLESSNVILNASTAWEQYADAAGKSVKDLSDQERAIAYVQGIIKETLPDVSDFSVSFGDFAQSESEAARAATTARREIGALAQEGFMPLNQATADALGLFTDLPTGVQRTLTAFIAGGAGATAFAGAVGTLALVLAPLGGPAGLFILTAAGISAVIAATRGAETSAEKMERLADAAEGLSPSLESLKSATSKEELLGAVETLAEMMDGDAKTAFKNYAEEAVRSAETVAEATRAVLAGVLAARLELKRQALDVAQENLGEQQANVGQIENAAQQAGPDSALNRQIRQDRAAIAELREDLSREQGYLAKAEARGDEPNAERIRGDIADIRATISDLEGYVREAESKLPEVRIRVATEGVTEAQAEVAQLTGDVERLTQLIETGTTADLRRFLRGGRGAGGGSGGNNNPPPPPGTATSEAGDYVVAPQPSFAVTDAVRLPLPDVSNTYGEPRPVAEPEVQAQVEGEPINIFGVVFDPATGRTSVGAAPTARVSVAVDVPAPNARGVMNTEPRNILEGRYGPGAYGTASGSVPLMTSPDYDGPMAGLTDESRELVLNADRFAEAGDLFLGGLQGVFTDAVGQLGYAIGSGQSPDAAGVLGGLAGVGSTAAFAAGGPIGIAVGAGLTLFGGILSGISAAGNEGMADSRRREADIERRGDVQTITVNLMFNQSNSFSGGLSEPQNRAALRGQTDDILKTLRAVLPLKGPKARGR